MASLLPLLQILLLLLALLHCLLPARTENPSPQVTKDISDELLLKMARDFR